VLAALLDAGVEVREVLRSEHGRWWSYVCESSCCPPAGLPLGSGPTSLLEVLRVASGRPVFTDRSELVASLDRDDSEPSPQLQAAIDDRLAVVARRRVPGAGAARDLNALQSLLVVEAGVADNPDAVPVVTKRPATDADAVPVCQPVAHSDSTLAFVAVALTDVTVRDAAFAWTGGPLVGAADALWRELIRRMPAPYAAAPATLLGVAAYRRGDGALADACLRRALTDDPGCRMADLVLTSIEQGFHPSEVERALGLLEPGAKRRSAPGRRTAGSRRSGKADAQ
jgi:hypothetical protein